MPSRDPIRATRAVERVAVVRPMVCHTIGVEEQMKGMSEGAKVGNGHYKERGSPRYPILH